MWRHPLPPSHAKSEARPCAFHQKPLHVCCFCERRWPFFVVWVVGNPIWQERRRSRRRRRRRRKRRRRRRRRQKKKKKKKKKTEDRRQKTEDRRQKTEDRRQKTEEEEEEEEEEENNQTSVLYQFHFPVLPRPLTTPPLHHRLLLLAPPRLQTLGSWPMPNWCPGSPSTCTACGAAISEGQQVGLLDVVEGVVAGHKVKRLIECGDECDALEGQIDIVVVLMEEVVVPSSNWLGQSIGYIHQ